MWQGLPYRHCSLLFWFLLLFLACIPSIPCSFMNISSHFVSQSLFTFSPSLLCFFSLVSMYFPLISLSLYINFSPSSSCPVALPHSLLCFSFHSSTLHFPSPFSFPLCCSFFLSISSLLPSLSLSSSDPGYHPLFLLISPVVTHFDTHYLFPLSVSLILSLAFSISSRDTFSYSLVSLSPFVLFVGISFLYSIALFSY